MINRVKGKEILVQAKRDIRKNFTFPGPGEKILTEILITQTRWEPEQGLTIAQIVGLPTLRAKILLESGKLLSKATIEENIKALEKALQFAQRAKNPRLMSEIAMAWFALEPDKGLELIVQVGSKEIRVKALRQMAQQSISSRREEAKRLLEKATQEALEIDGIKEKIKSLKEIANDWVAIDKEEAKTVYRMAYQLFEKASWINSKF
jgi:tetratricopeptide (TPR) repeat protein